MANLAISAVCNRTCAYCFTVDHLSRGPQGYPRSVSPPFLETNRFEERLAFLARSELHEVRLLGGEPTLHPAFVEFVEQARAAGQEITVFSNGLMPARALAYLASIPVDQCTVVINVNQPEEEDLHYHRQMQTIRRLGKRAMPGFTIYRPDFQAEFLVDLIAATGCSPVIRLGLAHPCLSGSNRYLHPNQYRGAAIKIVRLAEAAAQAGILLDFDCGFVRCMFSDADLDILRQAKAHIAWECSPILDVDLEGNVIHCYPLAQFMSLPLTPTATTMQLRDAFEIRTRPYRQAGVFPQCSACPFREAGECSGGCLAVTLRRFRHTPFQIEIPGSGRSKP